MKKAIALFLSCVLALTCAIPAFAAEQETVRVNCEYPIVIVRGMQFTAGIVDEGKETEHSYAEKIDVAHILPAVIGALADGIKSFSVDAFARSLSVRLKDVFAEMACDKNGNAAPNVTFERFPGNFAAYADTKVLADDSEESLVLSAVERYGAENVYYFTYDWRLDPYELAAEINQMVETAKSEHNTDKVNYICCSMGGVLTDAYLAEFGWESLNSCMFLSSTFQGMHCTTDLFQGKARIIEPGLKYMLCNLGGNAFLKTFLTALANSSLFTAVCRFGNRFIENHKEVVYNDMLRDIFGTMPALWSLVLPEELDACIEFMFPTDELKAEFGGVIEKAKRMQGVMSGIDEVLAAAAADGCKISVVAGYGQNCVPFYESAGLQGDTVLESDLMLGGAVVSTIGDTLGADYVARDPERLSPDRMVDLSDCLFPEYTWAINGCGHVPAKVGSELTAFVFEVLESPVQPTVDNMSGYSQFMAVDSGLNFVK